MPNSNGPIDLTNAAGVREGGKPKTVPAPSAASSELSPRPQRRTFSAAAKLRILEETDRAADTGGIAAISASRRPLLVGPDRLAPPARWAGRSKRSSRYDAAPNPRSPNPHTLNSAR